MKFSWFDSKTFHPTLQTDRFGYRMILLSHIANIVPIAVAISTPFPPLYKILMVIQLGVSITYHAMPLSVPIRMLDWVSAWMLVTANVFIFFSQNAVVMKEKLYIIIPLIVVSICFFFQFKRYAINHTIWHVLSTLITTIVVW